MKAIKFFCSTFILMQLFGCTPAKLVALDKPVDEEKATVVIYRESAFNAGGVGLVFGADSQDYVKLRNNQYCEIDLKQGKKEFFVRSDQADKPYISSVEIKTKERKCLKAYANPENFGKALLLPLAYYASHTFLFKEIECPDADEQAKYVRVPYIYKNL